MHGEPALPEDPRRRVELQKGASADDGVELLGGSQRHVLPAAEEGEQAQGGIGLADTGSPGMDDPAVHVEELRLAAGGERIQVEAGRGSAPNVAYDAAHAPGRRFGGGPGGIRQGAQALLRRARAIGRRRAFPNPRRRLPPDNDAGGKSPDCQQEYRQEPPGCLAPHDGRILGRRPRNAHPGQPSSRVPSSLPLPGIDR
jgi:hypothetical protein